jgi:hypothetical protein
MVSLDSIVTMPVSPAGEQDAELQAKLGMLRGSKSPSVLSRRFNRKDTMDTEGTSTTDDSGSRHDSDGMSDASQEANERNISPAIDFESIPEAGEDSLGFNFMSPDPFDYMPSVRVPAFFERERYAPTEVWPTVEAAWPTEQTRGVAPVMQPMAPQAPQQPQQLEQPQQPQQPQQMQQMQQIQQMQQMLQMQMQQMGAPAFQQMPMQTMQQMPAPAQPTASCAPNPSPAQIMVPVPVPVPFQMPCQMPFPMPPLAPQPAAAPPSVPVPAGFKLVKIPVKPLEEKTAPKSAIADPANTARKIFVGGLNPSTTGQTLREYFSKFGPVMDAKVIREGEKSKGFGFVQFKESIPAQVLEQTHIIDQRRCGVGPAFHRESEQ